MKTKESGPRATEPGIHESVAARVRAVTDRVARACERSGRHPDAVTIVAISKTFDLEHIRAAAAAGLKHFGENRVQEAQQKAPYAPDGLTWHMVGGLQRNKAKAAAGLFNIIQSVDSLRLARAIDRAASEEMPVLVQANVTGNPRQHGLAPDEIIDTIRSIDAETSLKLAGLMTIAPFVDDETTLRRSFSDLRDLLERVRDAVPDQPWTHLSMGMTNDFELAVEEGATIVRIGRAIFGDRR
ncbi:MAG: YggS family pyridoxal phosphate-dependent enzyme [Chloroflexi bacterium]|nr:YggS family pyridoxal phosphate-dependent enzyme [Chloroflexota bacterium]